MVGKIHHISLSRWRERAGVRVAMASDGSPSPVSSPPAGERIQGFYILRKRVRASSAVDRSLYPRIVETIKFHVPLYQETVWQFKYFPRPTSVGRGWG
jgi:hypothetical protein